VSVVPPQHGAWAFLALPLVVGVTVATWTPVLLVLAVAWISAYPWSYFALAAVRERTARHPHPERFRRALALWSAVALPSLLTLVLLRPWLLWVGVAYAIAFAVNVAYAMRRDDRALANDAVFIIECAILVPVTWAIGATGRTLTLPDAMAVPTSVWILSCSVALLLTGSTLHVRSLIRERSNPSFARLSQGFAIVSLVISLALATWWGLPSGLWLVPPFAFAAGRSVAMRGANPRPARIGMIELVAFVLLAGAAVVLGRS
jgi:hypothetical protein